MSNRHYDTQSLDAIKALPVGDLAADDCALFLWGVWPEHPGALEVIKAWGFEYKTVGFVWVKTTGAAESVSLDGEGLHWGMGYWTRANTEFCLFATRGSPPWLVKDVNQVILAPVGRHSEKPEETATRIERLLAGPYLELFARQSREGWTTWGNEVATPPLLEAAELPARGHVPFPTAPRPTSSQTPPSRQSAKKRSIKHTPPSRQKDRSRRR